MQHPDEQRLKKSPQSEEGGDRTVVIQDEHLRQFAGGFTSIPNRVLENNGISLGARMTYAMLLKYAWQKNFCFPAQESIAQDLAVSDRSVRTFLNELRDKKLISWKRQGLNRPNIYYILKLPDLNPNSPNGHSGSENISGPDRKQASGQERKQASDKEYSSKNTQNTVTVIKKPPSKKNPAPRAKQINWTALQRKYGLDESRVGRILPLVELQQRVLHQPEANHGLYVQRAAEAVRDRLDAALEQQLRNAEEDFARKAPRTTRSQVFHGRWRNYLEDRSKQTADPEALADLTKRSGGLADSMAMEAPRQPGPRTDPREEQRRGYLENLLARGYQIPARLAHASLPEIAAWVDDSDKQSGSEHPVEG